MDVSDPDVIPSIMASSSDGTGIKTRQRKVEEVQFQLDFDISQHNHKRQSMYIAFTENMQIPCIHEGIDPWYGRAAFGSTHTI